jgi:hypothetical protein
MGDPADPSTDLGPVVSEAHLEKVRAAVEKAVAEGARVPLLLFSSSSHPSFSVLVRSSQGESLPLSPREDSFSPQPS